MNNSRLLIFIGEFFGRLFPLILLLFWIPTLSTSDLVELSDSLSVYTLITSIGFWGGTSLANIDISRKIVQIQKLFIPFFIFVIFLFFLNDRRLEIISAYAFMTYTFFQTRYRWFQRARTR